MLPAPLLLASVVATLRSTVEYDWAFSKIVFNSGNDNWTYDSLPVDSFITNDAKSP